MKHILATLALLMVGMGIVYPTETKAEEEVQLLRFRATWCSPCMTQKAEFERHRMGTWLKGQNIKDVYIDADKNPRALRNWKVSTIPCTILVRVNTKTNKATVIRRLGGSKQNPSRFMDVRTYKRFCDPRPSTKRFIYGPLSYRSLQPQRQPAYYQPRMVIRSGNC